jgi:hypothetical protein
MLALRVIVLGKMSKLVDLFFFTVYLGGFSFWSFWNVIQSYGNKINPFASVHVEPFDPPLFGEVSIAHVQMISGPSWGALFLVLVPLAFLVAVCLSRRTWLKENGPSRDYVG